MEIEYTEQQQQFRREFRGWLDDHVPENWREDVADLADDSEEREEFLREWQATLADGNWAGIHWPKNYGGRDASLWEQTIYQQELARVDTPPTLNKIGTDLVGPTLMEEGTEAQKERFLPHILNGEEIWCQGYSEPNAGSDIASLTTKATPDGDRFVINGQKVWTSYAHFADWCFVLARTDDSGTKHEGITAFLVEMDQPGVETEPIHQATDDEEFNEVFFDDAVAHREHVVGEVDQGWKVAMTLSSFEHGFTRIFDIEQRFEEIVEYCQNHTRNGAPLSEDPVVRQQLAEFDTRIQAAKFTHYRNVSKQMNTGVPGPEGSMDLVVSDELANDLGDFAVSLLGPDGALWEDGHRRGEWVEHYLESFGLWIAAGTGDVQRNIIGERVLGLPEDTKSKTSHKNDADGDETGES